MQIKERKYKLRTEDNHTIYGILGFASEKNKALIIFVHGLTSSSTEHKYQNSVLYFVPKGFDIFRFDLYSSNKDGRSILDTTLYTHAKDLNTVVKKFKSKYKKIFVIGHSYGAPTILLSDLSAIDGIIFWDGSYISPNEDTSWMHFDSRINAYRVNWGSEYILSKEMIDVEKKLPHPNELIRKVNIPIKFIAAGKGMLLKETKQYFKHANEPKSLAIIKAATHNFDELGTSQLLYDETHKWLRKYV